MENMLKFSSSYVHFDTWICTACRSTTQNVENTICWVYDVINHLYCEDCYGPPGIIISDEPDSLKVQTIICKLTFAVMACLLER